MILHVETVGVVGKRASIRGLGAGNIKTSVNMTLWAGSVEKAGIMIIESPLY